MEKQLDLLESKRKIERYEIVIRSRNETQILINEKFEEARQDVAEQKEEYLKSKIRKFWLWISFGKWILSQFLILEVGDPIHERWRDPSSDHAILIFRQSICLKTHWKSLEFLFMRKGESK